MADVLAPQSERWARLLAIFAGLAERAGFGLVITPLIEHLEVFQRVGESTDIVRKEMYDFEDKGGRRRRGAPGDHRRAHAGLRRAPPAVPWKAWTAGPNFRYEHPQAARYRQHYQVDAEIVGTDDPDADVEVIALLDGFHRALGLTQRRLVVNSLGDDAEPRRLPGCADRLPAAQRRRPLRAEPGDAGAQPAAGPGLPKRPEDQPVVAAAPQVLEYLTPERRGALRSGAGGAEGPRRSPYEIEPRLVRGLDYYNHTLFEFAVPRARLGAERHRRRRSLQRPGRGPRRPGRDAAASASARGSSGSCWPAMPRACSRPRRRAVQVLRRRHDGRAGGAGPRRRAAGGRHRRRPVVRPAEHEEPDEGRRPLGCGGRGDRRTGRAGRRRRDAARRCGPTSSRASGDRRRCPARGSSTRCGRGCRHEHRPSHEHAHRPVRDPAGRRRRPHRQPVRLGGAAPRARRAPRLPRPAGPHGPRPVRRRPGAVDVRSEYVLRITGTVRLRPEGTVNPNLPTGEVEVGDCEVEVLSTAEPPPFPHRLAGRRGRRDRPPPLPLPRPAAGADAAQPARPERRELGHPGGHGAPGLRRGRDADAGPLDPGGRAGVPRAVPAVARLVLRAAPEPAAVQAAADGGRRRPLLPDRPLPPRRGPAGRPPVRVHAARRRDELRRPGRRAGGHRRGGARRGRGGDGGAAAADPAHHLARGHGPLRRRQARPALRHGAGRADDAVRGDRVQGLRRRGVDQGHPGPGHGRGARPQHARRAHRPGQAARAPRAWSG